MPIADGYRIWFKRLFALTLALYLSACSTMGGMQAQKGEAIKDGREVRSLLSQAVKAQQQGDNVNADLLFQEMMLAEARSPDALNSYAIFLREQWRVEEAETIYQRALKYSPQNAMTHWNLAVLYDLYLGQPDKALKHYQSYQQYAEQPDKRVHGWVVDMQQRIKRQAQEREAMEVASSE